MKPCSAWCRPDEGVHVVVTCASAPASSPTIQMEVGTSHTWRADDSCIPVGAEIILLSLEAATEIDPKAVSRDVTRWPYALLETVQVVP